MQVKVTLGWGTVKEVAWNMEALGKKQWESREETGYQVRRQGWKVKLDGEGAQQEESGTNVLRRETGRWHWGCRVLWVFSREHGWDFGVGEQEKDWGKQREGKTTMLPLSTSLQNRLPALRRQHLPGCPKGVLPHAKSQPACLEPGLQQGWAPRAARQSWCCTLLLKHFPQQKSSPRCL